MKCKNISAKIKELIKEFESKKAYICGGENIKSKIIAHSKNMEPSYFIRADYETGKSAIKSPIAYWQINNPFTEYFEEKRQKLSNLRALIKTEKQLGIVSINSKDEYKKEKTRYEFLTTVRQVTEKEFNERIQDDLLELI